MLGSLNLIIIKMQTCELVSLHCRAHFESASQIFNQIILFLFLLQI